MKGIKYYFVILSLCFGLSLTAQNKVSFLIDDGFWVGVNRSMHLLAKMHPEVAEKCQFKEFIYSNYHESDMDFFENSDLIFVSEESTGFVLWTLYLVVCGFLYAGYIFYLAVTGCYEIVQGTVIKMQKELPIDHLRVVQVQAEDGSVTELLLDKRTEVKVGKTYRFYFNSTVPSLSMIQRLDASFSLGSFWGLEKVKEET